MDTKHPILVALLHIQSQYLNALRNLPVFKKELISDEVREALKEINFSQSVIDALHKGRVNFDNYRDIVDSSTVSKGSISSVAAKAIDEYVKHDMRCPACSSTNVIPSSYYSDASCNECNFSFAY